MPENSAVPKRTKYAGQQSFSPQRGRKMVAPWREPGVKCGIGARSPLGGVRMAHTYTNFLSPIVVPTYGRAALILDEIRDDVISGNRSFARYAGSAPFLPMPTPGLRRGATIFHPLKRVRDNFSGALRTTGRLACPPDSHSCVARPLVVLWSFAAARRRRFGCIRLRAGPR